MSRPFHFKTFSIIQESAPMKVGTDGALLGAWVPCDGARRILDIGTGTGLIALMLAQRCPDAHITAIEPHQGAFEDARTNVTRSAYSTRIDLYHTSLANFEPPQPFDLIVCNPPFFTGDLNAPDSGRNMARHATDLTPEALLQTTAWLLPNGMLAGIYPTREFDRIQELARTMHLPLMHHVEVKPTPDKPPHRKLFAFGKKIEFPADCIPGTLVIESDGRHGYSKEFARLLRPFYLKL